MQVPGTLVVAGDFNSAVTLNIARQRAADLGIAGLDAADLSAPAAQARLGEALTADVRAQPGLFNFEVVTAGARSAADGRTYYDLEFRISTCRGEIVEGAQGRVRCVGFDDSTIPTPVKRVFQTSTIASDGYVYTAAAGAYDKKWDGVEGELAAAVRSFRVA